MRNKSIDSYVSNRASRGLKPVARQALRWEHRSTSSTLNQYNQESWARASQAVLTGHISAEYDQISSSLLLVQNLVRALDTGAAPIGGVRSAHAGTELIFATIESHRRGGARVELPLEGSTLRLNRDLAPGRPKYHA